MDHRARAEHLIRPHLEPGEDLLWCDAPSAPYIRSQIRNFSIIAAVLLLVPVALALAGVQFTEMGWFFVLPGSAGTLVGIWMAFTYRGYQNTAFAITGQRAIVLDADKPHSFRAGDFHPLEIEATGGGRGHIHLSVKRLGKDGKSTKHLGFEDIADPGRIADMLMKQFGARLREVAAVSLPAQEYGTRPLAAGLFDPALPADDLTFAPLLDGDEVLVWSCKADSVALRQAGGCSSAALAVMFGVAALAGGAALALAAWVGVEQYGTIGAAWKSLSKDGTAGVVAASIVTGICALMTWALLAPYLGRQQGRADFYAVTNRRVLIVHADGKNRRVTFMPHASIGEVKVIPLERGLSTIAFGRYKAGKAMHDSRFIGIVDGERIAGILRDANAKTQGV